MKLSLLALSLLLLLLAAAPLPIRSLDDELESDETSAIEDVSQEDPDEASEQEKFLPLKEVCYGDLGCFSNSGEFFHLIRRPVVMSPQSPDSIGTQFLLFTRQNPASAATLVYNDSDSVLRSKFNSRRPTKLVIHGFMGKGILPWMNRIRSALLTRVDCNVIQVGWSGGAVTAYNQATSNTRVVGAVVARMLAWLEARFGLSRDGVHIVGFSLGAHVAGYAGERMRATGGPVSRITGLDPAGPYFEGTDPVVRLDPTDAQFVDVVHTDGGHGGIALPMLNGGFGSQSPLGHVDFYLNGGHHQPGCSSVTACDHSRAPELFIAGLQLANKAAFAAFACDSYDRFLAGECGSQCPSDGCPAMGYWAEGQRAKFTTAGSGGPNRVHFLLTGATAPFALVHYHVTLRLSEESPSGRVGGLRVQLSAGGGGTTCGPHLLPDGRRRLDPLTQHRGVFGCAWPGFESAPVLQISWMDVSFLGSLITYSVAMDTVTLTEMATGRVHQFCRFGSAFASETWVGGEIC